MPSLSAAKGGRLIRDATEWIGRRTEGLGRNSVQSGGGQTSTRVRSAQELNEKTEVL